MKRFSNIAIGASLLVATLLLSLGIAELAVRLIMPQQLILVRSDVWQAVDTLGWAKRPNLQTDINTGERTVGLTTDSLGLRIPALGRPVELSATAVRVLLLGDSFMEALQVEYEQSLAGLLETHLSDSLGTPVEVWNTGVAGWGPSQYLLTARWLLSRVSFDHVIVALYVGNDAVLKRHDYVPPRSPTVLHRLRLPRSLSVREFRDAMFYPVNDFLERRSHLYILFKRGSENLLAKLGLGGPEFPFEIRRQEAASPRWGITADIAADLGAEARRHGVSTTFVLIPSAYQVDTVVFRSFARTFDLDPAHVDLDQPNRLLVREFRSRNLRVVDALEALRIANETGRQLFGSVDEHLSAEGHAVMATLTVPPVLEAMRARDPSTTSGPTRRLGGALVSPRPDGQ